MEVMILCGGQGTRIRDAGELKPKPMLEIGPYPILWHIMRGYAHYGHKQFRLCLGHLAPVIKDFILNYRPMLSDFTLQLGDRKSMKIHTHITEHDWEVTCADTGADTMTGGRVAKAGAYIQGDHFMLTYGDGVSDVDLEKLEAFHRSHGKIGTVTGVRPQGRFGELEVEQGKVVEFNEKPQTGEGYINGGFMIFKREFLDKYLSGDPAEVLEKEPLMKLAADGELMMFPHDGFWHPMDTYREFKLLNDLWKAGKAPWKLW